MSTCSAGMACKHAVALISRLHLGSSAAYCSRSNAGSALQAAGATVKRVVLTRLVGHTYYARLVLVSPLGQRSVDVRPSDSIALAMRTEAPLFVSRAVARCLNC